MLRLTFLTLIVGLIVCTSALTLAAGRRMDTADYAALDSFLFDPTCDRPCLFGITPGHTRFVDVVQRFEDHPWIENFWLRPGMEIDSGDLFWEWSEAASPLLNRRYEAGLWFQRGIVQSISIQTTIPYGAVRLAFGDPDVATFNQNSSVNFARASFRDYRWTAMMRFACPLNPGRYWLAAARLTLHREDVRPTSTIPRAVDWRAC